MYNKKVNYRWSSNDNDEVLERGVDYEYKIWNQSCAKDVSVPFRIDADYDWHPREELEKLFGKTFWTFYTSQSGAIAYGTSDVLHTIDAFIKVLEDMKATVKANPEPQFEYGKYREKKDVTGLEEQVSK